MKKIVAKLCMWILDRLGYEKCYSQKNEIFISVNAEQALSQLDQLQKAVMKLKFELNASKK